MVFVMIGIRFDLSVFLFFEGRHKSQTSPCKALQHLKLDSNIQYSSHVQSFAVLQQVTLDVTFNSKS